MVIGREQMVLVLVLVRRTGVVATMRVRGRCVVGGGMVDVSEEGILFVFFPQIY